MAEFTDRNTLLAIYEYDGKKIAVECSKIEITGQLTNFYHAIPYGQERCTESIRTSQLLGVTRKNIKVTEK